LINYTFFLIRTALTVFYAIGITGIRRGLRMSMFMKMHQIMLLLRLDQMMKIVQQMELLVQGFIMGSGTRVVT
jgi:hypothetical protein